LSLLQINMAVAAGGIPSGLAHAAARACAPQCISLGIAPPGQRGGPLPLRPDAIAKLQEQNYVVIEDFLPPAAARAILRDMQLLRREGHFKIAGVGEAKTNRVDDSVRRCEQCFLFPKVLPQTVGDTVGRSHTYAAIEGLTTQLSAAGEALEPLLNEGLYACYPNGGYYRRHVDAYAGQPSELRAFSYLIYLNEAWQESDGGLLRIFTDGGHHEAPSGAPPSYVDIEPRMGTLVLFRSDTVPHEVLDTSATRYAVAGWLSRPVAGSGSRRSLINGLAAALMVGSAAKLLLNGGGD